MMFTQTTIENGAPRTAHPEPEKEPGTGNQELRTENQAPRTAHGEQRSGKRARRTQSTRDARPVTTGMAPALSPWPQAVPIGEVGMRIRTPDDQGGTVVDTQDVDGTLTYLVQLDGCPGTQRIPARALKGVQL